MRRSTSIHGMLTLLVLAAAQACGSDSESPSQIGQGGTSGSGESDSGGNAGNSGGGSAAQAGNSAGTSGEGEGGAAGSDSAGGAGGAGGTPSSCSERSGGALIDFEIVGETLRVWLENDDFIDQAQHLLAADEQLIPVFNTLLDGQDCDPLWTWHPDVTDVVFADFTIELCDGLPSHVENDKAYWFDTVTNYCPWSAKVIAVDDRR